MAFWTVFVVIYSVLTGVVLLLTFQEQKRKSINRPSSIAIGCVLCTLWPAVIAVMLIFYKPAVRQG